jgi:ribosome-associated translation inhibitor RaiA
MHITVTAGNGTVDRRTRAYVESRLFNTLRSVERDIGRIDLSLSYGSTDVSQAVTCTIVLDFTRGEQIVATAVADWPYAAIDSAVSQACKQLPTRSRETVNA